MSVLQWVFCPPIHKRVIHIRGVFRSEITGKPGAISRQADRLEKTYSVCHRSHSGWVMMRDDRMEKRNRSLSLWVL